MTGKLRYEFRLFGALKNGTKNINGHQFINGEAVITQQADAVGHVMKILSMYGAYARGTPEYDAALAKEEAESGVSNQADSSGEQGNSEEVSSTSGEAGEPVAEETSDERQGTTDPEVGSTSSISAGNGHEDSRVPKFTEEKNRREPEEPHVEVNAAVAKAVSKLDPSNDEHWTQSGLPRLSAVEDAYGRAGITRQDIEAAVPGFNRETAMAESL